MRELKDLALKFLRDLVIKISRDLVAKLRDKILNFEISIYVKIDGKRYKVNYYKRKNAGCHTNNTGAPQGEKLGLMNPLLKSSCS